MFGFVLCFVCFFKQKTAYEMRISDWSSDVCSSDLEDPWDVIRWEAVALDLAEGCGLRTPPHHLHDIGGVPVLLVERFDRDGDHRIPFLSARSLIGAGDEVARDYLELVDALTEHGSDVRAELDELWQRAAFSIAF